MKKYKEILKNASVMLIVALLLLMTLVEATALSAPIVMGTGSVNNKSALAVGSIVPITTEIGKVSVSIDGQGVYPENTGITQVQKPVGATVRKAYLAAATTGVLGFRLTDGDITIDGVGVNWNIETPSNIESWNYWGEVTSVIKPKIDAAPAGRVDFVIQELVDSHSVDGEILVVVFDDPNQATDNTIVLLFGAQDIGGDTFSIGLANPLNLNDPNLVLDMSLGISYGYQAGSYQYSIVEVNGARMTTWAGGEDDGGHDSNGELLTVGGLDDANANPTDPFATPVGNWRYDDELYNLKPYVHTGDTSINVYTQNPSNDDNIFFAALYLASTAAVVGEGIVITPIWASNPVGTQHTISATVQDTLGNPVVGRNVTFEVVSGPHAGVTYTESTDDSGHASFTYVGEFAGTDLVQASFVNSQGQTIMSNQVTKEWVGSHDVAATGVMPSASNVTMGESVTVDVTVQNQGNFTETFNLDVFLSVYANTSLLASEAISSLAPGANRTLTCLWSTFGFLTGLYKVTAVAQKVPFETETGNNDHTYRFVNVSKPIMHNLTVSNYPASTTLLPFTVNNTRFVALGGGRLAEGSYEVEMPARYAYNKTVYEFSRWEDDSTNPTRTVNLDSDKDLRAYYEEISPPTAIVYTSPPVSIPTPDSTFNINLDIADTMNLHSWEIELYYDTRFMQAVTASEGQFLRTGGATTFQILELNDAYNSTHGRIRLKSILTEPAGKVDGNGTLAIIQFKATAIGNSQINIGQVQLFDPTSAPMPSSTIQGVGLVRVKMAPDINNDGIVNILDLVLVALSFSSKAGDPQFNPQANLSPAGENQQDTINILDIAAVAVHYGEWEH